jgi:hypothetical protein
MDRAESSLILGKRDQTGPSEIARRVADERDRAAKVGYTPETPVSLDGRFRVEGLTAIAPTSPMTTKASSMLPTAARAGLLRVKNPYLDLAPEDELRSSIDRLVERVTKEKRGDLKGKLLDRYMSLAATTTDQKKMSALEKQVFSAVFGTDHAKRSDGGRASGRLPKHSK